MPARELRIPVIGEVVVPSDSLHPINRYFFAALVEFNQMRVCRWIVAGDCHTAIASHFWVHILGYKVFVRRWTAR